MFLPAVPAHRVRTLNDRPLRMEGGYVLYWMVAARRTRSNFGLQHALSLCQRLNCPLLVLEALQVDYPWASQRHHRFVIDGMADQAAAFAAAGVRYHAYVEPEPGAGAGLLRALAADAVVVVADDWPYFIVRDLVERAARSLSVRLEVVDSVGIFPLSRTPGPSPTAASFRRHLQRVVPEVIGDMPVREPLCGLSGLSPVTLPEGIGARWPMAAPAVLAGSPGWAEGLRVDDRVRPVCERGGAEAAGRLWNRFLESAYPRYATERSDPDARAFSGLSPYLHYGHIGVHELVADLLRRHAWTPEKLGPVNGSRAGYWGLPEEAESFLDELITWRELGHHFAWVRPDWDRFETLPPWALATMELHASDPRDKVYSLAELDQGHTGDPVWNAAQRELRETGRLHNYLRMLWGKRILGWTEHPKVAMEWMLELNNRYALDGRDPNSVSGISWVLGRFDRAWGPERAVFGTIRYMSSENTLKKLRMREYMKRWSSPDGGTGGPLFSVRAR